MLPPPSSCTRDRSGPRLCGLVLLAAVWACSPAGAQECPFAPGPLDAAPSPRVRLEVANWVNATGTEDPAAARTYRFRLFRMPSGFMSEPVNVQQDDAAELDIADNPVNFPDPFANFIDVAVGIDNPFVDFRLPGDPGGVGYYRLHSQVQVVETPGSGLAVGLQAVMPAGLESNGVASGPRVLTPSVAWFQELGSGTAVQAFAGQELHGRLRTLDSLERGLQYGVALAGPVCGDAAADGESVHLFVEVLGHARSDGYYGNERGKTGELLPGVHWHRGENLWLSGGFILPLDDPRPDLDMWQITCQWRF